MLWPRKNEDDEAQVEALYRRFGPVIYARCCRLLGDGALAEDATQETFVRVMRHIQKAPDAQEALAWIYRIATNYCLNEIRNRKRRPEPLAELPEVAGRDLESVLMDRVMLRRLILEVDPKLRVPAWLCHVDGMTQEEAAKVLGVSRRTVVNRLAAFDERCRRLVARLEVPR